MTQKEDDRKKVISDFFNKLKKLCLCNIDENLLNEIINGDGTDQIKTDFIYQNIINNIENPINTNIPKKKGPINTNIPKKNGLSFANFEDQMDTSEKIPSKSNELKHQIEQIKFFEPKKLHDERLREKQEQEQLEQVRREQEQERREQEQLEQVRREQERREQEQVRREQEQLRQKQELEQPHQEQMYENNLQQRLHRFIQMNPQFEFKTIENNDEHQYPPFVVPQIQTSSRTRKLRQKKSEKVFWAAEAAEAAKPQNKTHRRSKHRIKHTMKRKKLLQQRLIELHDKYDMENKIFYQEHGLLYAAFFIYLKERFSKQSDVILFPIVNYIYLKYFKRQLSLPVDKTSPFQIGIFLNYAMIKPLYNLLLPKKSDLTFRDILVHKMKYFIFNAIKRKKYMVVFPVCLSLYKRKTNNSSVLIFRQRRIPNASKEYSLEWYDPMGKYYKKAPQEYQFLVKFFHKILRTLTEELKQYFKNIRYFTIDETCPMNAPEGIVGLQEQNLHLVRPGQINRCAVWSYFFAEYAIRYPNLSAHKFIEKLFFENNNQENVLKQDPKFFHKISEGLLNRFNNILKQNFEVTFEDIYEGKEKFQEFQLLILAYLKQYYTKDKNNHINIFEKLSNSSGETINLEERD